MDPDDAIGGGPFIYIALPAGVTRIGVGSGERPDLIPVNATRLLREWEILLDPITAMRARRRLKVIPDWVVGDIFVEPTWSTMDLVARAARTEEVYEAFANSGGRLSTPTEAQSKGISDFALDGRLQNAALPILLGLGVVAAFFTPIGFHSREARKGL